MSVTLIKPVCVCVCVCVCVIFMFNYCNAKNNQSCDIATVPSVYTWGGEVVIGSSDNHWVREGGEGSECGGGDESW